LSLAPYVSSLKAGEQVYPVAVPPDAPLELPADPAERLALLRQHAVDATEAPPAGACEGFLRMSGHHWLRFAASPGPRMRRLADPRWLAGHPDARPELAVDGTGPEVEVFCP
jgi:hypothetical protein